MSSARRPRLRVTVTDSTFGGGDLPGVIDATVIQNNSYRASKFTVTATIRPNDQLGAAFWAQAPDPRVEVFFGLLADGALEGRVTWQSMILGRVDDLEINPIEGTITLNGRDLTALLIDAKTAQAFTNQTSSEIVTTLAAAAGLKAQVTTTSTPVGQYYQIDHIVTTLDQFHHSMTDWDLMTWLARREGFDLFVTGQTLYFQPPSASAAPFQIQCGRDLNGNLTGPFTELKLHHSKTLAKDIKVTVRSWNTKSKRAFTAISKAVNTKAKGGYGPEQNFVFIRPNLTQDAAQKLADQMRAEISRHERVIDVTMPGELSLTARGTVQLTGTGTDFDQTYFPDEIRRTMSFTGGFEQMIRGKNHSPQSETEPTG